MSKIALTPNASGTGTFTLASPNSSTSRTLTLPDTTGVLLNDASSLASGKLTGALPAIDGSSLTGMLSGYSAKAWANINGTGTIAIRADGNVSSITDIGTGAMYVNFGTSFSDNFYSCPAGVSDNDITSAQVIMIRPELASRIRIQTDEATTGAADDCLYVLTNVVR